MHHQLLRVDRGVIGRCSGRRRSDVGSRRPRPNLDLGHVHHLPVARSFAVSEREELSDPHPVHCVSACPTLPGKQSLNLRIVAGCDVAPVGKLPQPHNRSHALALQVVERQGNDISRVVRPRVQAKKLRVPTCGGRAHVAILTYDGGPLPAALLPVGFIDLRYGGPVVSCV
jgi:hypothetical protein